MKIDHYRESVWNAPDLTALEKLVLVAMTKWMDHRTLGDCRPGHVALMRRTSLSKKSIERTVASAIGKDWLVEDHHGSSVKGGQRSASIYRGKLPDRRQRVAGPDGSTGDSQSHDWRQRVAPPSQGPADDAATRKRASSSATKRASRASDPSSNGSTPCDDPTLGCDGWRHVLTDPVQPCPRRRQTA